jgi:hypothetical protein
LRPAASARRCRWPVAMASRSVRTFAGFRPPILRCFPQLVQQASVLAPPNY